MDLGLKAKKNLTDYVLEIDPKLSKYWDQEINQNFGYNQRQKDMVKVILEHTKEHNLRPSKRLRGSFVNYAYMLTGEKVTEKVWNAALGVELVHTGLLIHDDFMDRDETRRGAPTTHKFFEKKYEQSEHFGHSMAINAGDLAIFLGLELLIKTGSIKASEQMLRGISHTAFGQSYDVTLEFFTKWTEDDVMTLHKAKTAIYTYKNPLFVGAYLAGIEDKKVYDILDSYSMDGGVAFQLQDDILGIFGTPEKTGKSADSDIKQGKCTLLILYLLENGTQKQKESLKKVWGNLNATKEELDDAKQAIKDSGSYDYSKKTAVSLAKNAAMTASKLRDIRGLNVDSIDYIQGIAEYMVNRDV